MMDEIKKFLEWMDTTDYCICEENGLVPYDFSYVSMGEVLEAYAQYIDSQNALKELIEEAEELGLYEYTEEKEE